MNDRTAWRTCCAPYHGPSEVPVDIMPGLHIYRLLGYPYPHGGRRSRPVFPSPGSVILSSLGAQRPAGPSVQGLLCTCIFRAALAPVSEKSGKETVSTPCPSCLSSFQGSCFYNCSANPGFHGARNDGQLGEGSGRGMLKNCAVAMRYEIRPVGKLCGVAYDSSRALDGDTPRPRWNKSGHGTLY